MSVRRVDHIPRFDIDLVHTAAGDDPDVLHLENLDTDVPPPAAAMAATRAVIGEDDANSWLPFTGRDVSNWSSQEATRSWSRIVVATALVLLAGCTGSNASDRTAPTAAPTRATEDSNLAPGANDTHPFEFGTEKFRVPPEDMPYPYTTPTPAPEPTPLDGTYMRILTLQDVGGLLPFRCLRCPPYFPNAGVSTLVLYRGNYWLNHQLSGFRALGMFTLQGHWITFFNDPWCPRDRGTYRWDFRGGELSFEAVSGTCDLREGPGL